MIIYPAIDLRNGRCVRLRQGDPDAETVFGDDPAEMALHWQKQGAQWLHVVNLDGALDANERQIDTLERTGTIRIEAAGVTRSKVENKNSTLQVNLQRLKQIRQAVDIPIQFGGGLRTMSDIKLALGLGADRVVLGTVAVERPQLVADAISLWGPERIVVGIDARDGKVATHGWQETSDVDVIEIGHQMYAMGVRRTVFTDIARDGMLSGVNIPLTTKLGDMTDLKVIASGGVKDIHDIRRLKAHEHYNLDGVIVGQAIYTKSLDLTEAIELANGPLHHTSAGIIPYRRMYDGIQYLLLYNIFCEQWQFPRGGASPSEVDAACALESFHAETGLPRPKVHPEFRVELNYMREIRDYSVGRTIIYYLAEAGREQVVLGNDKHCEARWLSYDDAWELLTETGPEQVTALEEARRYLTSHKL